MPRPKPIFLIPLALLLLHAAPALADTPKLDRGDTAWMLTSTALVLMMTIPGLALFYAGMVRKMNLLNTMAQSFAVTCLVTVVWMIIGYSIAFTGSGSSCPPRRASINAYRVEGVERAHERRRALHAC